MARLLVIDDSLTVRKVVELSFRTTDWSVDFAASGTEGVAAAVRLRPDLILLDFVLPDMKATDVCEQLAQHGLSASIPVLVMSGNLEKVRQSFNDLSAVVDFIAKPFTPQDLVARMNAALARRPAHKPQETAVKPLPSTSPTTFSYAQKEAGARALYARLRPSFAQIPEWASQLNGAAPAQFFARKILTPELMADLMDALLPVYQEILGSQTSSSSHASADSVAEPEGDVAFQGRLSSWPVLDLLKILDASGRTGLFRVHSNNQTFIFYVRHGEIVVATCLDPTEYMRESTLDLRGVPQPVLAKAEAEQRASGLPVFVELSESGYIPQTDLAAQLCEQGKRLLLKATELSSARFSWDEQQELPPYVEAYGRRISLAQIPLERLRRERPFRQAEQTIPSLDIVFERTEGFTRKLRRLDLTSPERLVLALVDRRNSVQDIVDRSGLSQREALLILHRLAKVDLIRGRGGPTSPSVRAQTRPIMILEPDVEGFQRPLAELLKGRSVPIDLVVLNDDPDPLASIMRVRPSLVILNASAADRAAEKIARGVRATPEVSDLPMLAVLNVPRPSDADQLSAAGFDAVLNKPVSYADIERMLVS